MKWFLQKPRKKSSHHFKISRLKSVLHNDNSGECGVYSREYIEYKAIGCGFERPDQCIHEMRIKLAAEVCDEAADL